MQPIRLYFGTLLIWGTSWYAVKLQLTGLVAPEVSVFYRFALATTIMFSVCLIFRRQLKFGLNQHLHYFCLGIFLFMMNYWLIYHSTRFLSSGLVAVVFSTVLIFNMINGKFFLNEPFTLKMVAGTIAGISGIALIFTPDIRDFNMTDHGFQGLVLALSGTLSASFGMILSGKIQQQGLPVLQSNTWGMLYGTLVMFIVIRLNGITITFDPAPLYVGSLAYLAVLATVVGFHLFLTLVGKVGAAKASYVTVMFPVVALLISTFMENYQWSFLASIGLALTLLGNFLILDRR